MHYRREIDGLRALAIIPVILFHAGFNIFSGGFIGVDVFFVISGYLITTIILEEKSQGTFSLTRFYERRARRILPTLFFVMIICLPFAWLWMLPPTLKAFSESLGAISLFISNILFWKDTSYFGTAAELKPLLHTWSLALEEQFYLLFPLFLLLAWPLGKKRIIYMLALIAIASLGMAQWFSTHMPTAGFFLPHTRIWELIIGVLCAYYLFYNSKQPPPMVAQALSMLGFCCIVYAILNFNITTPYPSVYTLIPTLGAACIILFATPNTWVGEKLCNKYMVTIGLISYGAYLWHQPMFAFARLQSAEPLSAMVYLLLICCALLLAYCTWKFIETPLRKAKPDHKQYPFLYASIISAAFVTLGILGYNTNGYEKYFIANRLTADEKHMYALLKKHTGGDELQIMGDNLDCNFWDKNINPKFTQRFLQCNKKYGKATIVLGDSHAENIYNALYRNNSKKFLVGVAQGYCRPHNNASFCQYDNFEKFANEFSPAIEKIIYHQSGAFLVQDAHGMVYKDPIFDGRPLTTNYENIEKIAAYLNKFPHSVKVIWLGPFVEARLVDFNKINHTSAYDFRLNQNIINLFEKIDQDLIRFTAKQQQFKYVSLIQALKMTPDSFIIGNCISFRDKDHLSVCGEAIFGAKIRDLLA